MGNKQKWRGLGAFDSFVALGRPSTSEERGRLEKKKKAELNIADRGCDSFFANNA